MTTISKKNKKPVGLPNLKIPSNNNKSKTKNPLNRPNIPNTIKKQCYKKGISLFRLNENKVSKKNVSVLQKQCNKVNNKVQNKNTKLYGVPPKPERVLAIMFHANSKLAYKNAVRLANDPFYNFGIPTYLPTTPRAYRPNTWPTYKQHKVYQILPAYFHGKKKIKK